ncbi:glycosyltransferase family protein [Luteimonas sp. A277]
MDRLAILRRLRRAEEELRDGLAASGEATLAAAEVDALRGSTAYRLGRLIVDAARSPRGIVALPGGAFRLLIEYWRARAGRRAATPGHGDPAAKDAGRIEFGGAGAAAWAPPMVALPDCGRDLRIAGICDRFTADNLAPECEFTRLHPDTWSTQIGEGKPHLLFVESAWEGMSGEWRGKVQGSGSTVAEIVAKCRELGIPSVFWNKEDPLHFEAFLPVAAMCDVVFTTDAAMIPRYKRELAHERVYVLPFALQPALHHPIQNRKDERVEGGFFAGAWYGRHPSRCRDFMNLADALSLVGPFEIFDRNSGSIEPDQRYPDRYARNLRPAVEYSSTPALYRRYRIGLTLNTIKQSPTMFARRALELIGTGTSVYSNYSSALSSMFGNLVVSTDDGDRILREAYAEIKDPLNEKFRARRQAALRKVLLEHCWEERLRMLLHHTYGTPRSAILRDVTVVARVRDEAGLRRLSAMLDSQKGVSVRAWADAPRDLELPPALQRLPSNGPGISLVDLAGKGKVAPWHADDFYGEFYLLDLLLSLSFRQGEIVGKASYSTAEGGLVTHVAPELENRKVGRLAARRALLPASAWAGTVGELLDRLDDLEITGDNLVSVDGLSYIQNGGRLLQTGGRWSREAADDGWPMSHIRHFTEQMPASTGARNATGKLLTGAQLATLFGGSAKSPLVSVSAKGWLLELVSRLPAGQEIELHSRPMSRTTMENNNGKLEACLEATPSPAFELRLQALDRTGAVLVEVPLPASVNVKADAPGSTSGYRFSLRVRGNVVTYLDSLLLSHADPVPVVMPGQGRLVVVVNQYPSRESLYRNAFVHRRVKAYQRLGVAVDVVWVTRTLTPTSYEFDGVQVQVCDADSLRATLRISGHEAIAVHFLDRDMWTALEEAAATTRTVVWLHGSDIQSWHRRKFNFRAGSEQATAARESEARTAFWKGLMEAPPAGLGFVFVSRMFAGQVWEDIGVQLPDDRWTVIHNPIDTGLFQYWKKSPEQRFRILLVRPHHSRVYANDVAAKVISLLSLRPEFRQMSFLLVGDGPLFEENFGQLLQYPNVHFRRSFLTQQELASLYRDYGIFLVPTRADTQGVTRDEAMACGLVAVTNRVGAVAEFVDNECAILAAEEDAEAMAEGILSLLANPDRFQQMSAAAAARVRMQSDMDDVIAKEIEWCMGSPAMPVSGLDVIGGASN